MTSSSIPPLEIAGDGVSRPDASDKLSKSQARLLYLSHALSTWNARTYEFAAILFTATAFPNTLLMSSLRGLSTAIACLLLSSAIGSYIDQAPFRLRPLFLSIFINRGSIICACFLWLLIIGNTIIQTSHVLKLWVFALVVIVGIFEKLSGIANMISMERDWVPCLADDSQDSVLYSLTALNATMRRIDLICKLVAPVVISVLIELTSMPVGILTVGILSLVCWGVEVLSARNIWQSSPRLRTSKEADKSIRREQTFNINTTPSPGTNGRLNLIGTMTGVLSSQSKQLREYFESDVWMPSLALSLLHLSALSYAATFVTFLLNSGFSLLFVTVSRTTGSVVEISSTFLAPFGIRQLDSTTNQDYDDESAQALVVQDQSLTPKRDNRVGLARSGLWGVSLQCACLIPVVASIWNINRSNGGKDVVSPMLMLYDSFAMSSDYGSWIVKAVTLVFFLSVSRLGLWVFDLTTQEITQTRVTANKRSSFAGTEMMFVSFFELIQWTFAAIFPDPSQFRWLALGSLGAVCCSTALYAYWVRQQRGHLIHWQHLKSACHN